MNKSYISVWNDVSGTWVAAPETARTHRGAGAASSQTIPLCGESASRPATPLKAAFMPIAMAIGVAMLPGMAAAQATTGNGGLELCPGGVGGVGSSWGPLSSAVGIMDCSSTGESTNGMSFSLNNSAADNGAWGFNSSNITARVTGYDDGRLELKGMGGISMLNDVSMTGNKITDLAAGGVSSGSADAVNGAQLYQYTRYFQANSPSSDASTDARALGTSTVASGPSSLAIGDNSSAYGANAVAVATNSVALGAGSVAARPDAVSVGYLSADGKAQYTRQITNVTEGSAGTDAVNVDQLNAAIAGIDPGLRPPVDNPVAYDSSTSDLITLKGTRGTKIQNLVAGDISSAHSMEAVNGSQLFETNQNVAGVSSNLANVTNIVNNWTNGISPLTVAYDSLARDTVTLGGTDSAPVKLRNVAAGDISSASSNEAVNGGQLYKTNKDLDALAANVGQIGDGLYDRGVRYFHANSAFDDSSAVGTESVAIGGAAVASANNSVALGSNSVADRDSAVSVGAAGVQRQIINVAEGTQDTDAVNVQQMNTAIHNASIGSGPDAVIYDSPAHDTLTLGGTVAPTPPVLVKNLAAGQIVSGSNDAVNGDQLYKSASGLASALGAGASVSSDGSITAPGYLISGTTYNNVGDALFALNTAAGDLVSAAKYVKVVSTAPAALVSGGESVAIGGGAMATKVNTLAIGTGASATFENSTAIGVNATTDASYTVSVGSKGAEMRITHVADGMDATDAVTVGQMEYQIAQALGSSSSGVKSMGAIPVPVTDYIAVSPNVTQGSSTSASNATNAMAIGPVAAATGTNALGVGAGAAAGSDDSTAVGSGAGALSVNSTAIGASATVGALSDNSVSIGYNTRASQVNALALGAYASSTSAGSVAIGYKSFVWQAATNGVALGVNAEVSAANSVAIGSGAIADRANAVSVGNSTRQSQIINLAAGTSGTDAVNVNQLSGVAAAIGGGAAVNPDGTIKSPSFTIGGQTYADVGTALAAATANSVQYDTPAHTGLTLGSTGTPVTVANVAAATADDQAVNLKQLKDAGLNVDPTTGDVTNSFVAYDDTTLDAITLKGANGTTIANVKAGDLSPDSMEAVNGSQLSETNANVANVAGDLANVAGNVTNVTNIVNNIVVDGGGIKYFHTNSSLDDSSATGVDSVAIGGAASATAANSVALGTNSVADRVNTVSVGAAGAERQIVNVANGTNSTDAVNVSQLEALGANIGGDGSVTNSFVSYDDAAKNKVTLGGVGATVPVLLGNLADGQIAASSDNAVTGRQLYNTAHSTAQALGGGASVLDDGTLSQPSYVIAGSPYADVGSALTAVDGELGQINTNFATNLKYVKVVSDSATAQASGSESIAIGGNAMATKSNALAIGAGASAGFANSTALGVNAVTDAENTLSVGSKGAEVRITHVANGIDATDAVNMAQWNDLQAQLLADTTSGVKSMMQSSNAVLSYIAVSSKVVAGANTTASDDLNTMAIGPVASATGDGALAVGGGSIAGSAGSTAVGSAAGVASINATAIGAGATVGALSADAVSIGYNARASAVDAIAVGTTASATSTGSVAIGYGSFVSQGATNSMAFGWHATANAADSVAIGSNSIADRANAVSVGNSTSQSQIIHLAAGTSGTDAVNVNQLSGVTAAIGGGASVNPDGTIKRPSYTIGGQTYTDVGAALVAAANFGGTGPADAVTYDTPAHTSVKLGNAGTPVTVSNVANGVADPDAVNVSQLKAMGANFDGNGNVSNAFVAYDDVTKSKITLGGATAPPVNLTNVAVGAVTSGSKEAINGSQLFGAMSSTAAALGGGSTVGSNGQVSKPTYTVGGGTYSGVDAAIGALNAAIVTGGNPDGVIYDTPAHDKLTLGNAATPVTIANVAAATTDDEAVNLKQLKDAGLNVDPTGNVTNPLVTYDDTSKTTLTFNPGGAPTQLKNVAAGTAATDAVNVGQMQTYVSDYVTNNGGGGGTANAVAYDDASKSKVTLGGAGSTTPVTLTNLANGTSATDAVTYGQFSSLQSQINNLARGDTGGGTYVNIGSPGSGGGTAAVASGSDAIAIGNGAAATGSGAIAIGKGAVTAGDNSVAMGAGATAPNANAVALGSNSTTDRDNSVSVGSAGAERQITNVAAGTQLTDAVNLGQLNNAMGGMNNTIHNVDRNAAKGIASASALNIVTPYLPGRTTMNAGIANYRGYQAVGLGVSRWNEKGTINYNLGVSTSGGNSTIVRAGIGIVLGN
ncbi:YadA domain-containing protein [Paraburkholderia ribeironis]|uniref:YadA domain-containing protein n=1 Tax=Paraburkholderia ribeironis TaxID=1247936 RepID=A0A1N7SEF6_9BURK|nr:YadA-like family protein [Paraburkholderia ribeironis]SIT45757.1 YadA domain-containing protein [Paraburkholderia ribeironis]